MTDKEIIEQHSTKDTLNIVINQREVIQYKRIVDKELLGKISNAPFEFDSILAKFVAEGEWKLALLHLSKHRFTIGVNGGYVQALFDKGFEFVYKNVYCLKDIESTLRNREEIEIDYVTNNQAASFVGSILKHKDNNIYCYIGYGGEAILYSTDPTNNTNVIKKSAYFNFAYSTEEEEQFIVNLIENELTFEENKPREGGGHLHLIVVTNNGLQLRHFPLNPIDVDFNKHYNEDFKAVHDVILEALSVPKGKGITILHGIKGSGKSSYIKYITTLSAQINKKFIFLPTDLTSSLATPGFNELLIQNPGSIVIIEDGENVVKKRTGGDNGAVATILNLSDGLLSDCLGIQFIITLNTNLKEIDDALTRKGRLIAEYEFKELTADRAKLVVAEEYKEEIKDKMTLADALNYKSKFGVQKEEKAAIGFSK